MSAAASTHAGAPSTKAFGALELPGYPEYLLTFLLTMMADNIEHVISYWVMFQKFHSPALGGFAVVSHWLPYLVFSVSVGALNDRFDSRRIIQAGALLFIIASAGWGYFFVTGTLQMWHAMVLLVIHGCAGVLWMTSSQMLLYDIVGPAALPSAVRLAATARYLGVLVGPGVGGLIMLTLGPTRGIFLNTVFYLPLFFWLVAAPYGATSAATGPPPKRAVRGLADIVQTIARGPARSPCSAAMIAARRRRLVLRRQQLPGADAGLRARPRARRPGTRVHDAARRPTPRARSSPASCSRAAAASSRMRPTTALVARHGVGRGAPRLRAGRARIRSRSRCSSPPGSSSCRSAAWRRRSCR